jgi:hypothetical protein
MKQFILETYIPIILAVSGTAMAVFVITLCIKEIKNL